MHNVPIANAAEIRLSLLKEEEMSNEQGFQGIPGLPDGFELVEFRHAFAGDFVFDSDGFVHRVSRDTDRVLPIVRKIEKPKQYRPFANAEEFKPFRDAWFVREGAICQICRYDDDGIWIGGTYHFVSFSECCRSLKFDDGSPFGVEVTE